MEPIKISDTKQQIEVQNSCADHSKFICTSLKNLLFDDVNMSDTRITNANLSDIEIDGAQLGGAYIHNIGMPPEEHPFYVVGLKQRPLRFENCDLNNSSFSDCNLSGVSTTESNITGMTINGIQVTELLRAYEQREL